MKTLVKSTILAACAAAPLALVAAAPAHAGPGLTRWINYNDLNDDGVVARHELRQRRIENFDVMDSNDNGFLDQGDLSGFAARRIGVDRFALFISILDANGDGAASYDEVAYGPMPVFDTSDVNHDGVLTRSEIEAFLIAYGLY